MAHLDNTTFAPEVTGEELAALSPSFSYEKPYDIVTWTCPRCKAEFRHSFVRDSAIYKFAAKTDESQKNRGFLDLVCDCGRKHTGGGDQTGCGFAALYPVKAQ
jgi:hypothetical protein